MFQKKRIRAKKAYREIYSDLVIAYEENVLVLTSLILKVLDNCKCDFLSFSFDDKIASDDLNFARLCTILKIELICLNRHMKLENGGHVLFDAIAKPVFDDLKESFFYEKYRLNDLYVLYQKVQELYDLNPYQK